MVQQFVEGYSKLFKQETYEDDEEGEEQGDTREVQASVGTFGEKWGWIAMVDRVSETVRDSWEKVMGMNVFEFFNIVAYATDKAAYEKEQLENWKRNH